MADKTIILITGTTSGIGKATAFALANRSGSNHVIMTARSESKGKAALTELQERKPIGTLSFVQLDSTSDESIDAAAKTVDEQFGRVDVLINNAAVGGYTKLVDKERQTYTRDELNYVFNTNVFGTVLVTQAMEPLLRKSPSPRVVYVTSVMGSLALRADPDLSGSASAHMFDPYRASKSAVNMMALCFRAYTRDWCKSYIYCPGFVQSNLTGGEEIAIRAATGGMTTEDSSKGVVDVVEGKRDGEWEKFINHSGATWPW